MENENKNLPETDGTQIQEPSLGQTTAVQDAVPPAEKVSAEKRCPNCAAIVAESAEFCPECGASLKRLCPNCSAELKDDQKFCPVCGTKTDEQSPQPSAGIQQFNAGVDTQNRKKKRLPVLLGGIGALIVVAYLLFAIFLNPQHYIKSGNYQAAYKVASQSTKETVVRENIIAVLSDDCIDNLKDSSSFVLKKAWLNVTDESKAVVLEVSANNSYGNPVTNYWYFLYSDSDKKYNFYEAFADFDEEKTYSWDDSDTKKEKALLNIVKSLTKHVMDNGAQINTDSIANINKLFEDGKLENVTLLDVEPQITSK